MLRILWKVGGAYRVQHPVRRMANWSSAFDSDAAQQARIRRIRMSRVVPCSPEAVFRVLADVQAYPSFVPYCLSAKALGPVALLSDDHAAAVGTTMQEFQLTFGSDSSGVDQLQDTVAMAAWGSTPSEKVRFKLITEPNERVTLVATDTMCCQEARYDWRLRPAERAPAGDRVSPEGCEVRLSFSVQFHSVLFVPAWDLQTTCPVSHIMEGMLRHCIMDTVKASPTGPSSSDAVAGSRPHGSIPASGKYTRASPSAGKQPKVPPLPLSGAQEQPPSVAEHSTPSVVPTFVLGEGVVQSATMRNYWELPTEMLNSVAKVLGIPHELRYVEKEIHAASPSMPSGNLLRRGEAEQQPAKAALEYITHEEVEQYVQGIVTTGRLKLVRPSSGLGFGEAMEMRLYTHCIKILLAIVHNAMQMADGATLFGEYEVVISQLRKSNHMAAGAKYKSETTQGSGQSNAQRDMPSRRDTLSRIIQGTTAANQAHGTAAEGSQGQSIVQEISPVVANSTIDREVLKCYVDSLLAQPALNSPYVPDSIEGPLYMNCLIVIFNLVADLTSGLTVHFMGHTLHCKMAPDPLALTKPLVWIPSRLAGSTMEDQIVEMLVDEIMSDSALNTWWIPDSVERQVNEVATRFVVRVVEQLLEQASVSIMDVDASITLVPIEKGPAPSTS